MKKVLAIILCLSICLFAFGCASSNSGNDDAGQNGGNGIGSDNGNSGGNNGNGQTGSGNKDRVKTQDEVMDLIGEKYLISVEVDSSYTDGNGQRVEESVGYTTVSNGVYSYWGTSVENLENGSLYKRCADDSLAVYDYNEETGEYDRMSVFPTEINPFRSVSVIFLADTEIEFTTKTNTTFLGRPCTQYNYRLSEASLGGSASLEKTWIIDNATGACLKFNGTVTGNGFGVSSGASGNFEVVRFEQGAAVDQCISGIVEKISINEWDVSVLEKLGLRDAGGSHLALNDILQAANVDASKLQVREVENEVYEDTGNGNYSTQYFAKLSETEGEELVRTIITNLYQCGAKYNDEGTLFADPLDEPLCYIDRDGNVSYSFMATPGAGDPYLEVRGEWNPYVNGGVWSIDLSVYYHN